MSAEALVSGRGAFRFHRGPHAFTTLAEASRGESLDPSELARVASVLGPSRPGRTIYRTVAWAFEDTSPAARAVPLPTGETDAVASLRDAIDDAVDRLAERGFPIEHLDIVGSDLKLVDRCRTLLAFAEAIRPSANYGGFASTRAKVMEKMGVGSLAELVRLDALHGAA